MSEEVYFAKCTCGWEVYSVSPEIADGAVARHRDEHLSDANGS